MRDQRDMAGFDIAFCEGRIEPDLGANQPETVGTDQRDFVGPGDVDDLVLQRLAAFVDLTEARG